MMDRLRAVWLPLFCLGMFVLCDYTAFALDLKKTINSALTNSFELKRLREKTTASRYTVGEKQGYFNPSIDIEVNHSEAEVFSTSRKQTKTDDYSISISQPIYNPSLWSDYRESAIAAKINDVRTYEASSKQVLDTLLMVINICRIRSRKTVTSNSLKSINQSLDFQKKRLKADYGSRFDLAEIEAEAYRYQKEEQEIQSALQTELFRLKRLTNQDWQEEHFPVFTGFSKLEASRIFEEKREFWINHAYRNNSQLKIQKLNKEIGRIQQSRSTNSLKPELDLVLIHNESKSQSTVVNHVMDNTVKLKISLGFSPVSTYYRMKRFDAEWNVLLFEEQKIKKDLEDKIETLLNTLLLKKKDLRLQRQWMAKQEEIGKLYEKGLEQRHFPVSQVLEASRKRNESQLGSMETVIGIWENRINLLHIAGLLNKSTISQLDQVF